MKKTFAILMAVMMVLSMVLSVSATRDLTYTANYGTITVDGTMEDAWKEAEWTAIDLPYAAGAESVCSARARLLHDDTLLYVLVEVTDATVADGNGDALEIYFDEDNCHDDTAYCSTSTQLQMHLDGTITNGANSVGQYEDMIKNYIVTKTTDGYLLEFSVALMNGMPADGTTMGLEFMYNDNDADGAFLNALRWNVDTANGDAAPWQVPQCFGALVIGAKPVAAETTAAPEAAETTAAAGEATDTTTTAPTTADAGIVAAVAIMAIAAGVVLSKKH